MVLPSYEHPFIREKFLGWHWVNVGPLTLFEPHVVVWEDLKAKKKYWADMGVEMSDDGRTFSISVEFTN